MHSSRYRERFAGQPEPVTVTTSPSRKSVDGVTVIVPGTNGASATADLATVEKSRGSQTARSHAFFAVQSVSPFGVVKVDGTLTAVEAAPVTSVVTAYGFPIAQSSGL